MANEKRLILLDHALQVVSENYRSDMPKCELDMLIATRKRLKAMPTVDAVEVVRCKDCKNRDEITKECKHPKAVGWDVIIPEDNDFCSYGERRTDG